MNRLRPLGWVALALSMLASHPLKADHPPAGKIRVAGRPGENFDSIKAAIDAALVGGVVLIGEGRYNERLRIAKPVRLVGAGPDKTVIGPTGAVRDERIERCESAIKDMVAEAARPDGRPIDDKSMASLRTLLRATSLAVVKIDDVQGVELRSLRVTSPGSPRAGSSLGLGFYAIELKNGGLSMADCAVVGCLYDGVHAVGNANLAIDDCLIAGCWGHGVATARFTGELKIVNSDIRNCYLSDIQAETSSDVFAIEGCRISGSSGFGVHVAGRPVIRRCAIFQNAHGISAEGDCLIRQNLVYKNEAGGLLCSGQLKGLLVGNLFLDNEFVAVRVYGECQPMIRRNVFIGSGTAVEYGPLKTSGPTLQPLGVYYVRENLFWNVDQPVERYYLAEKGKKDRSEPVELPAGTGNRVDDPQITRDADGRGVLAADSPARRFDFADVAAISTSSRWPLTADERSMIPDVESRMWSNWKMTPPRGTEYDGPE